MNISMLLHAPSGRKVLFSLVADKILHMYLCEFVSKNKFSLSGNLISAPNVKQDMLPIVADGAFACANIRHAHVYAFSCSGRVETYRDIEHVGVRDDVIDGGVLCNVNLQSGKSQVPCEIQAYMPMRVKIVIINKSHTPGPYSWSFVD
jgi:hypothetical protein